MASEENREFVFTAKLNRAFTHSPIAVVEPTSAKTIRPGPTDEADAKAGLDSIAEQGMLAAVLAQFPISFKCTDENREYVRSLAERFHSYPLVLEIRHASWNEPEILAWLAEFKVGLCNIDQPLLGRAIRPGTEVTSPIGYVRLHGRNYRQWFAETNVRDRYDYLYSAGELEKWKERTVEIASKAQATYVVANNHNLGKAAVNALELVAMLENRKVRAPEPLVQRYSELEAISFHEGRPTPGELLQQRNGIELGWLRYRLYKRVDIRQIGIGEHLGRVGRHLVARRTDLELNARGNRVGSELGARAAPLCAPYRGIRNSQCARKPPCRAERFPRERCRRFWGRVRWTVPPPLNAPEANIPAQMATRSVKIGKDARNATGAPR